MGKKLLIVTTNYSGEYCEPEEVCIKHTGVYLEEFAVPYLIFEKSYVEMTVASIEGGVSPVDDGSMSCSNPEEWDKCAKMLRYTKNLYEVDYKEFDGVYFPGGHGPLYDIAESDKVREIVEYFYNSGKVVSAICHGVCALLSARTCGDVPIVKGKRVTSFTNREEEIVKLSELVPFSIEEELKLLGADYIGGEPWAEHVEVSQNIITGQNQNSATLISEKILQYWS